MIFDPVFAMICDASCVLQVHAIPGSNQISKIELVTGPNKNQKNYWYWYTSEIYGIYT